MRLMRLPQHDDVVQTIPRFFGLCGCLLLDHRTSLDLQLVPLFRTRGVLGQEHMPSLADVAFTLPRNSRESIRTWLDQVWVFLQANDLDRWTRSHLCSLCAFLRAVAVDGKVAVSAPLCAHAFEGLEDVSFVGVQIVQRPSGA